MYYISNEALKAAIRKLHSSGAHESFRNWLVLKAFGLRYGAQQHIVVDTKTPTSAIKTLFGMAGLSDDEPFYNPLRNELLKKDAARGIIQTNVKKYLDEATKTKMKWLEGFQDKDQKWQIRFSTEYPGSLGRGEVGLADSDNIQLTVDTPSFVLWLCREGEWNEKPTFEVLWANIKQRLNLHPVEIDLVFTKQRSFDGDPFVDTKPDRALLVSFISEEANKGKGRDVLKLPDRPPFSEVKARRIISSQRIAEQAYAWWSTGDLRREALAVLKEARALLLVGPPGTGKTRLAFQLAKDIVGDDKDRIHLFQFHASYAYEDFIEALRPEPAGSSVVFKPIAKRFLLACEAAEKQPQVVILDELNRADVSKVFGEAFLLVEREYRQREYAIPRLYDSGKSFWIPPDLYMIATLNNLDKSTYDLDFAFRRRFGEVDVLPDSDLLEEVVRTAGCHDEDFVRILRSAFNQLQTYYPLGHAYFKAVKDRETLLAAYRRVIRPTIAAYLGQYRSDDLNRIDSIVKRVGDVQTWEEYINIED